MRAKLYSLEDYFDTLSRSGSGATRRLANYASAFFATLGDVLSEGRKLGSGLE